MLLSLSASLSLLSLLSPGGQDWPQFRGPGGLAVAADAPIPTRFGPEQGVLWKAAVPAGHSSPCLVDDRIFVAGFEGGENVAVALDRATGETVWRRSFEGEEPGPYFHPDAAPSSPTPVSDGELVIFYFGNYGLVALDWEGEDLWEKRLPAPGFAFGVSASPILAEGFLIVPRDGAPEAALLGLDATDGAEIWRVDRFGFRESHGSPFLWRHPDGVELIVSGTNRIDSFDLATGRKRWGLGGLTAFPCTTPTADDDTLYVAAWSTGNATGRSFWEGGFARSLELTDAEVEDPKLIFERLDADSDGKVTLEEMPECRAKDAYSFFDANQSGALEAEEFSEFPTAPGKNLMVAVARGAEGEASEDQVRWSWSRGLPYVSSPLLYRGRIWLFKSGGIVTCLDAATGEALIDRKRLSDRSEYYMSPVGAGGHVIIGTAEGTLYLLDAEADELTVEHTAVFDEGLLATPAVVGGVVYLRTETALWAFASED